MATFTTTRTITTDGITLTFTWHGGAYVDVSADGGHTASEVINVWDHETDRPLIERTQAALVRRVDEWIEDYGQENLAHDVTHNW